MYSNRPPRDRHWGRRSSITLRHGRIAGAWPLPLRFARATRGGRDTSAISRTRFLPDSSGARALEVYLTALSIDPRQARPYGGIGLICQELGTAEVGVGVRPARVAIAPGGRRIALLPWIPVRISLPTPFGDQELPEGIGTWRLRNDTFQVLAPARASPAGGRPGRAGREFVPDRPRERARIRGGALPARQGPFPRRPVCRGGAAVRAGCAA